MEAFFTISRKTFQAFSEMYKLRLGHYFKISWSDGTRAILNRPLLSVGIFAAIFASSLWRTEIVEMARVAGAARGQGGMPALIHILLARVLQSFATMALTVHVIRYALLGGNGSGHVSMLRGIWRAYRVTSLLSVFAVLGGGVLVLLMFFTLHHLAWGAHHGIASTFVSITFPIALCFFIMVRLSFLTCSGAIGERLSISAAWHLTEGHFWALARMHFLVGAPLVGMVIAHACIDIFLVRHISHGNFLLETKAVEAILVILGVSVGATCLAWLYRDMSAHATVLAVNADH